MARKHYFVELKGKTEERAKFKANKIWKAGFFDPRSLLSGLSFEQIDPIVAAGQYFYFDQETQLLTVAGDTFQLTPEHLDNLFGMLFMADNQEKLKESEAKPYYEYKDVYKYYGEVQPTEIAASSRVVDQLPAKPLVIESTNKTKTYIIDVQYKNKNYMVTDDIYTGSYISYYFVLGISNNGAIDQGIKTNAVNAGENIDQMKDVLVKIQCNNPYAFVKYYYPYKSGNDFKIDITTGIEGSVTVDLSADDIRGLINLIKNYEQDRTGVYVKSDYVYKGYPYRLTFHFDGTKIFVLPVYKWN